MHPPAHVCRALYNKYPELRLAWHGQWGKFCIVRLSPKRMTKLYGSAFEMFDSFWDRCEELANNGASYEDRDYKGPVFNKDGIDKEDWDLLSTDIIMMDVCNNIHDVFSGKIVKMIQYRSRKQELQDQAKYEHEKGKMLRDKTLEHAESTADKVKYYVNRHDGLTTNLARKHLPDIDDTATKDPTLPGLEYYHVHKRGLKEYL